MPRSPKSPTPPSRPPPMRSPPAWWCAGSRTPATVTRCSLPDVVLMDLDMRVMDGIEATKRIMAERPQTAVVVLTAFSDRPRIIGALDAGASGYLLKDVDAE